MDQIIVWSKALRSALWTFAKRVLSLHSSKPDKRRLRKSVATWFDFDFKKWRFRGGRMTRFDQN